MVTVGFLKVVGELVCNTNFNVVPSLHTEHGALLMESTVDVQ